MADKSWLAKGDWTMEPYIIDALDETFEEQVLDESQNRLVIVDFWASWCGPCRVLKPILEQLAEEFQGAFLLAKVNTEENVIIARQLGVQGIPDVKFFRDGQVVDGFVGVQQESVIRDMISRYTESPAMREWKALQILAETDVERAIAKLENAEGPLPTEWTLMLVRLLMRQNRDDEAFEFLTQIRPQDDKWEDAQRLLEVVRLKTTAKSEDVHPLNQYVKQAVAALNRNDIPEALEALLEILYRDRFFQDELARKAYIALLDQMQANEDRRKYQRRLSMAIHA